MRLRPLAAGRLSITRLGCMASICSQQSGSSQSTRPSPSLSMQSPQISTGACGALQSAIGACAQVPAVQLSVVQALWSSQSLAVVQGSQPPIAWCAQAPAEQLSVVQALWSSQSLTVVQGWQPAIASWLQPPAP